MKGRSLKWQVRLAIVVGCLVAADAPNQKAAATEKEDAECLQGTWVAVYGFKDGEEAGPAHFRDFPDLMIFEGDKVIWKDGSEEHEGIYDLDASTNPETITFALDAGRRALLLICKVEGKELTISGRAGTKPPKEFGVTDTLVYRKIKSAAHAPKCGETEVSQEMERLQGKWLGVRVKDGNEEEIALLLDFKGDKVTCLEDEQECIGTYDLDLATDPKSITLVLEIDGKREVRTFIYELDENQLRMAPCRGTNPPWSFAQADSSITFRRPKSAYVKPKGSASTKADDAHVQTIYVPIFENRAHVPGLEQQLAVTRAIIREIEAKSLYRVVSDRDRAATELLGTIVSCTENDSKEPDERCLTVRIAWRDLATGESLLPPCFPPFHFRQLFYPYAIDFASLFRAVFHHPETATIMTNNIDGLAVQIVSMMEKPW
jgi:uncharacterized protein (TIGR03067 family)